MPFSARSLRLTDAYRTRIMATRSALEFRAQQLWPTLDDFDSEDWIRSLERAVVERQRIAVNLTTGYLGAYLSSEFGIAQKPPTIEPSQYIGTTPSGADINKSIQNIREDVRFNLRNGIDTAVALRGGLIRAKRFSGLAYDFAHRTALLDAIADDARILGWKRAIRGTCGACAAAASGTLNKSLRFEIHPSCQCVSEPEINLSAAPKGSPARRVSGDADGALRNAIERAAGILDDQVRFEKPELLQYVDDLPNGFRAGFDPNTGNILMKKISDGGLGQRMLDFIHERAHSFDTPVGSTKWKQTKSKITATPELSAKAAAARNELLEVIKGTSAYRELQEAKRQITKTISDPTLRARQNAYLNYLMSDHELIARTFTQYMGTVRPELRSAWRQLVQENGSVRGGQSIISDDELAAVIRALEKYLRARGAI